MSVDEMKVYGDTPKEVLDEGIAVNSTASIDFSDKSKPQILGNPTEGALLLWLNKESVDYRRVRERKDCCGGAVLYGAQVYGNHSRVCSPEGQEGALCERCS